MRVRVDRVGRLVLPKSLRRLVGLEHGGEVDVTLDGTALRLEVPPPDRRRIEVVDGWPVLSATPGAGITDADVRALRDEQR